SWRIRVYWEDTDAGGVVYHASYLRFLERARTEWLRALGLSQTQLRDRHGVVFVVRGMTIGFDKPARLDDELDATVALARRRSASLELAQTLTRAGENGFLTRASVRVACVGAANWLPCRITDDIAALIEKN
ncbi:MAG: tol-pal system-associated acyl-CoA thioesterase, partial [Rhodanobacteraceae bacterium]